MKRKIFMLLFGLLVSIVAFAQTPPTSSEFTALPIDPQLRYGKLSNGLTYYIRRNAEPRNRADFYIAQRVGSMQEEESQRGLAHFLEHMAFNGTTHYPKKEMLNYLETIGAKFGVNVNAYTSFDETVYNLSDIPTTRVGIIDSCLLVLHDWATAITLNDSEIDAERPLIKEEWRTRNTGHMRVAETLIPMLFPDSRYANRMPIGDTAIIASFTSQQLRDYYHKWYRPDLQAIVVVGDFDPDIVESKVKQRFGAIKPPINPAERVYFPVQDNTDPIVAIASDKELTNASVTIFFKHNVIPEEMRNTVTAAILNYIYSVSASMLNARFDEIVQKPNSPFIGAASQDGRYHIATTKDAFTLQAICSETNTERSIERLLEEVQRVKLHGFTESEYDRARSEYISAIENVYNERNKHKNGSYVREYVDHFLNGGYIPGIETEYRLYKKLAPEIPVEQVNQVIQNYIGEKNIVISLELPEKAGYTPPSSDNILAIYDMIKDLDLDAYDDIVLDQPLVAELPQSKEIVKNEKEETFGATVWTLANGATVVAKPTDYKEDEIIMTAVSLGGSSLISDVNLPEIKTFNDIISLGGVGEISAVNMQKIMAGKRAAASIELNAYSEGISATCSPKDLESMMQLVYLNFTAPRKDIDAFRSYTDRLKDYLKNIEANPATAFHDSLMTTLFPNNPRAERLKAADVQKVNYESILRIQRDRFKYASDFTFLFIGNIDTTTLKPLVEQYIGGLRGTTLSLQGKIKRGILSKIKPSSGEAGVNETYRDLKMYPRKGVHKMRFSRQMQTPKVSIAAVYSGKIKYSLQNSLHMSLLTNILNMLYTEKIRQEQGGTYGVSVSGSISPAPPKDAFSLRIAFDTNKEQADKLLESVHSLLKEISTQGPDQTMFTKAKEYMQKQHAQNIRTNGYWLAAMSSYYLWNADVVSQYEATLNNITPAAIRLFSQQLLSQRNLTEVIMEP